MAADLFGIGMGGVDDDVDLLLADEADQPLDAAEAAGAGGARQGRRLAGPARQRADHLQAAAALDGPRQLRRLGGAAENKDAPLRRAVCHVRLGKVSYGV
jgi:hypothetical protein